MSAAARAQSTEPARLDVATVDVATLDPAVIDYATLGAGEALTLTARCNQVGDHAKALRVLQGEIAGLELASEKNFAVLALLRYHAADAYRLVYRFESALDALQESERCLERCLTTLEPGSTQGKALEDWGATLRCSCIGLRGWIHQDWGALDAAQELFERERAELDQLAGRGVDVSKIRADADRHWASLAMRTGSPERIEKLLDDASAQGPMSGTMRACLKLRLAGAWLERGRREAVDRERIRMAFADALAEKDLDPIDRVFAELWLSEMELEEGHPDRARELWQSAGVRLEQPTATTSRARRRWVGVGARLAATREEREHWRTALSSEIESFLADWHALDAREGGYGLLHLGDSRLLFCEYTELSLALDGAERGAEIALELLARAHAESTLARKLGAAAPSVAEIRGALCASPGAGVLVYLAGPARSWVFVLDRDVLRAVPLGADSAFERPRRRLLAELLAGGGLWTDAVRTAAQELGRELLPGELRAQLERWTSVAVCGLDLFLGDVPFELLDLRDGRPIGLEKRVWHIPPLAASVELARRATHDGTTAIRVRLLAAPTVKEDLGVEEFELDPRDLERMLRAFPPAAREVFTGAEANVGALASPSPPVLQLLAHGTFDESRSRSAELALAPAEGHDGLLSAADIERTWSGRPAPRLVVLTACRAGRGVQRSGDCGATDLAGAFLASGAQVVLASPYDLDLSLACELSGAFYAALGRGLDAAEALRSARAELALDPEFSASLQPLLVRAVGFAPAPLFQPGVQPGRNRMLVYSVLLVVVALGLLALRRRATARSDHGGR